MPENINLGLSYLVLASHAALVIFLLAIIFRHSWGQMLQVFLGKNALVLALSVSLVAVMGSLFYSEVRGFEPCVLCWWQRVFLYPLPVIFGIALWKKDNQAFLYAVPLVVLAGLVAIYQYYAAFLGGTSLLSCTDAGGACSKVYVMAFGYITIELMSLTASLYILLLAWANKIYLSR